MKDIAQVIFSIAALIAASAALVFSLHGGTAHAASSQYDFQAFIENGDEVIYFLDTQTGKMWRSDVDTGFKWGEYSSPVFKAADSPKPKKAPTPPVPRR